MIILFGSLGPGFSYGVGDGISALINSIWAAFLQLAVGAGLAYLFGVYVFHGKVDFLRLAYVMSLYAVPLGILYTLIHWIFLRIAIGSLISSLTSGSDSLFLYHLLIGLPALIFWLAVAWFFYLVVQAVFKFNQQNSMYMVAAVVGLPLLASLLSTFGLGWFNFLNGLMYGPFGGLNSL